MSTIARLKELSAEFQDEMSGISMEEFREIMNALPKLLAILDLCDLMFGASTQKAHDEYAAKLYLAFKALKEKG